jgi:hypothetical protein
MRKVTVRISDELFKKLGHYCVDADKSVNEVITELLEKLVSEGKKTNAKLNGPPRCGKHQGEPNQTTC